jgi:ubiquinone/menaquinone biosynthesis C-methylase UbiE
MPSQLLAITDLICGYRKAKILFTAVSLNLFKQTRTPITAKTVSVRIGLDARATVIFLDALTAMGWLTKKADKYVNTAASSEILVPGGINYVGGNIKYQDLIWNAWSDLKPTLQHGTPTKNLRELISNYPDFTGEYISGMQELSRKPAMEIADSIDTTGCARILDVGGGSGIYSISLLKRNKNLRATIIDLPETLNFTRKFVDQSPYKNRVDFIAGDYHTAQFGKGVFDLILFSHVTHDEGEKENKKLFKKAFTALKQTGQIAIHDFMLDKTRTQPLLSALFSVHMLVYTENGRVYTQDEYASWLKQTGFSDICNRTISSKSDNPTKLMLGIKK